MNKNQEFEFHNAYELADLVDCHVKEQEVLDSYICCDTGCFIEAATSFCKDTLLHLYIEVIANYFYRRNFLKNGDLMDEESFAKWHSLFLSHRIDITKFDFKSNKEPVDWFDENCEQFGKLFYEMTDEVFYILFSNRQFLLKFNKLIAQTVKATSFPGAVLTSQGKIKRKNIPAWVKTAVFHRDKGRCVFCYTDLTKLINTSVKINYDHMIPLDLYGTNDPCNIQLTCEKCNKTKTSKPGITSNLYCPWW